MIRSPVPLYRGCPVGLESAGATRPAPPRGTGNGDPPACRLADIKRALARADSLSEQFSGAGEGHRRGLPAPGRHHFSSASEMGSWTRLEHGFIGARDWSLNQSSRGIARRNWFAAGLAIEPGGSRPKSELAEPGLPDP